MSDIVTARSHRLHKHLRRETFERRTTREVLARVDSAQGASMRS
jgi:hypothetical protein